MSELHRKPCRFCGREFEFKPNARGSAPVYCKYPDCKKDRNARDQAHSRAKAAATRVLADTDETIRPRHESGDDTSRHAITSRWDVIAQAWQTSRFPITGPGIEHQHTAVDRLMEEAEAGVGHTGYIRKKGLPSLARRDESDWSPGELWLRGESLDGEERTAIRARAEQEAERELRLAA